MYFEKSKTSIKQNLGLKDKSRKGEVDKDALPIINAFFETKNYYTTSSCSGRISLFREAKSKKKHESGWNFVKHGEITYEEIKNHLQEPPEDTVWFRCESPIFHVACKDIESATKLLTMCRELGLKHSGIIGINRRVMVEIIFNEKLDCPISENTKLYTTKEHIELLIKKSNEKIRTNKKNLQKLAKKIKTLN